MHLPQTKLQHLFKSIIFIYRSQAHSTSHNCDSTIGLYGSIFGQLFHEILDDCHAAVKSIKIRHEIGNRINGIQLIYQFSNGNGQTVNGNMYGGTGGILSTINFDINKSERVVAVLGNYDTSGIRGLVFFTSLARIYGPYGGQCAGEFFRAWSCQIRGVRGVYS